MNGNFVLLSEDNVPFVQGKTHYVTVYATGDVFTVDIDGTAVFADATHTAGSIAFYGSGKIIEQRSTT
jgi:hypothetical protein